MTVTVLVVGIGSGDPMQLTGEAVAALNRVDVFLVADKGAAARDLVGLRTELCRTVIRHNRYRVVEVSDPARGPDADRGAADYRAAVAAWHAERARRWADAIATELPGGGVLGLLVWGDPCLYDSTLRILDQVADMGVNLAITVIPGISSLQLLAARHRITLNRIGRPVHVTTGRRLLADFGLLPGDVAVMLDGDLACRGLASTHPELTIFWGAQLGLPDERLVAGPLGEVITLIAPTRARIRDRRGWVMDTYLLRHPED